MRKLILCCLLSITACSVPPRASAPPTPGVITVALTPALRPMVETLHACATNMESYVLNINETPVNAQDLHSADVIIHLGGLPGNNYPVNLGEESIQLIINADNSVSDMSVNNIHDIYTGRITSWDKVGGMQAPIQVWSYPYGDDVRSIFDSAILLNKELVIQAQLAPDPQAMLEAITSSPQAIGYMPQSWLVGQSNIGVIKTLGIDKNLADALRQPILAMTLTQPKDPLLGLLACLQSTGR